MELSKSILLLLAMSSLVYSEVSAIRDRHASAPVSLISSIPSSAPTSSIASSLNVDLSGLPANVAAFLSLPMPSGDLAPSVDESIKSICDGTDYVNECILAIIPLVEEGVTISPLGVLRLEMNALFERTNETLQQAKHMCKDPYTPRVVARILNICVENYESLLDDLKEASIAIKVRDFGRLETVLSASIDDISTCSTAFAESGAEDPLAHVDEYLTKLCSNVLAISQNLKHIIV